MSSGIIEVAVAILRRADSSVLLCQRPAHKSYPLKWEFPGGKIEFGETAEQALARELSEELSITAEIGALFHEEIAHYPADGKTYQVRYFFVENWEGEIQNNVFADHRWVPPKAIAELDILEGNWGVVERLEGGIS